MDTSHTASFADAFLHQHLDESNDSDLDALDFGVIAFDGEGIVRRYNSFESKAAGLSPQRVMGSSLFDVVAP